MYLQLGVAGLRSLENYSEDGRVSILAFEY